MLCEGAVMLLLLLGHMTTGLEVPLDREYCAVTKIQSDVM